MNALVFEILGMPALPEPFDLYLLCILWTAALVALGWACIPPICHILGLSRYHIERDDRPLDEEVRDPDAFTFAIHKQLESLGFHPLGYLTETHRFFVDYWKRENRFHIFGSIDKGCFAFLYRLHNGEPVRVSLATCFEDEAFVWTSNFGTEVRLDARGYVRHAVATNNLQEVLIQHQEVVEQFKWEGRRALIPNDLGQLLGAAKKYAPTDHHKSKRNAWAALASLIVFVFIILIFAGGLALLIFGSFNLCYYLIPVAIVGGGLLNRWGRKVESDNVAKQRWKEVKANQARSPMLGNGGVGSKGKPDTSITTDPPGQHPRDSLS
jgi:hypothetical protein